MNTKWSVIDTNVAIKANQWNGRDNSDLCAFSCVQRLETFFQEGGVVIDSEYEIFNEYAKHLSRKGSPGYGDRFLKWLFDNQYTEKLVKRVKISPDVVWGYAEFPHDSKLAEFDKSDKKFVAVANACEPHATIIEATDTKWWKWAITLKKYGINVSFIDEKLARDGCKKKNNCDKMDCSECDK